MNYFHLPGSKAPSVSENSTTLIAKTDAPKIAAREISEPETHRTSSSWKTVENPKFPTVQNRSSKFKLKTISPDESFNISSVSKENFPDLSSKPAERSSNVGKSQTSTRARGAKNSNFSSLPDINSKATSQPRTSVDRSPRMSQPSRDSAAIGSVDFGARPERKTPGNIKKIDDASDNPQNILSNISSQPADKPSDFSKPQTFDKPNKSNNFDTTFLPDMSSKATSQPRSPKVSDLSNRMTEPVRDTVSIDSGRDFGSRPARKSFDTKTLSDILSEPQTGQPILPKESEKKLTPQEEWELKNREKIIEREQEKLATLKKELEKLPANESQQRETLEASEFWANKKLQNDMKKFEEQTKEIKAREEEEILAEAKRRAAIFRLEREEELAAEKAKPLTDSEIGSILYKYQDVLEDQFLQWKKKHPYGTTADFIDFELGLTNKQINTLDFTKQVKTIITNNFLDFKDYNQATQDLIVLKLEQEFFRFDQPRKSELEWNDTQKQYIKNFNKQNIAKEQQARLEKSAVDQTLESLESSPENKKIIENAWLTEKETSPSLLLKYLKVHKVADLAAKVLSYKNYVDEETWNTYQSNKEELEKLVKKQNLSVDSLKLYLTPPPDSWFAKNQFDNQYINALDKIKSELSKLMNFDDLSLEKQTSMIQKIIHEIGEQSHKSQASLNIGLPLHLKQQKEEQIKKLNMIMPVLNPVSHFIDANKLRTSESQESQALRKNAQEALERLKDPNSLPLSKNNFAKFEAKYQEIFPSKK